MDMPFGLSGLGAYSHTVTDNTALHEACRTGDIDRVRELLQSDPIKADINALNSEKETPLYLAIDNDHLAITKLLLEQPDLVIDPETWTDTPVFHLAVQKSCIEFTKLLLEHKTCDPMIHDKHMGTPLKKALCSLAHQQGSTLEHLRLLLACSTRCHIWAYTPHGYGIDSFLYFLLNTGSQSFLVKHTLSSEVTRLLIEKGFMVSLEHATLPFAIERSTDDVCRLLIESGANVNAPGIENESSLHVALQKNSLAKCRMLVRAGADLTTQWQGLTPLQYAIAHGNAPEILTILSEGVAMTTIQKYLESLCLFGESPLTCSIRLEMTPWIAYFSKQYSILEPDQTGLTPLELGMKKSFIAEFLMDRLRKNGSDMLSQEQQRRLTNMQTWYKVQRMTNSTIVEQNKAEQDQSEADKFLGGFSLSSCLAVRCPETKRIADAVLRLFSRVSSIISQKKGCAHWVFTPQLAGSEADGTKTFIANEFDVICMFTDTASLEMGHLGLISIADESSPWVCAQLDDGTFLSPPLVAEQFYALFQEALEAIVKHESESFRPLLLHPKALQMKDKISLLHLLWRGEVFRDMMVYVDVVAAFQNVTATGLFHEEHYICKVTRRAAQFQQSEPIFSYREKYENYDQMSFTISTTLHERAGILALPDNGQKGLALAKALRHKHICAQPESFLAINNLEHGLSIESFITSYMLKMAAVSLNCHLPWSGQVLDVTENVMNTMDSDTKTEATKLLAETKFVGLLEGDENDLNTQGANGRSAPNEKEDVLNDVRGFSVYTWVCAIYEALEKHILTGKRPTILPGMMEAFCRHSMAPVTASKCYLDLPFCAKCIDYRCAHIENEGNFSDLSSSFSDLPACCIKLRIALCLIDSVKRWLKKHKEYLESLWGGNESPSEVPYALTMSDDKRLVWTRPKIDREQKSSETMSPKPEALRFRRDVVEFINKL